MLRYAGSRALLIVLSLGVCAGRLHAPAPTPLAVQQELNCCFTLVRVAVTRRGAPPPARKRAIGELANRRIGESVCQRPAVSLTRVDRSTNSPIHHLANWRV